MKHLSGLDSTFLHLETPEMPMHVGSLNVLDLPEGYKGNFFDDAKANMLARIHLADVFTRKLALMPFDLSNPVWVEEDDLDIDHHFRHITLPKPGTNRQLQQVVARLHSSLLDRSRPLWEFYIIDGLKSGQVGLYTKVHHAGIDGQAGVEVGKAIFDTAPTGRVIKPPRVKPRGNKYQLGMAELASAALKNTVQQYVKLYKMAPALAQGHRGPGQAGGKPPRARTPKSAPKKFNLFAPRTVAERVHHQPAHLRRPHHLAGRDQGDRQALRRVAERRGDGHGGRRHAPLLQGHQRTARASRWWPACRSARARPATTRPTTRPA